MIYDLLEIFQKEYEKRGDKLILDNYVLKNGLYVRVNQDNSLEYFIYQFDKKVELKDNCFKDLDGNIQKKEIEWFKERDYYSNYLNSNKSFSDKKIHNVNYLSFFVKVDSFISKDSKKLLKDNAIKGQYDSFLDYKKFTKPKEKEILTTYQNYLDEDTRKKDIEKKYLFIKDNIHNIVDIAVQNRISNYIKIFFDKPIEEYIKESEIYYSIKIFNKIEYTKILNEKIIGLPDSNMVLNDKKPYLQHKTRKIIEPFMISNHDALMIKRFFDWLKFQDYQNKYPNGNQFFINRDYKEKDLITEFDYLPIQIDQFDDSINIKNHLQLVKDKQVIDDNTIKDLSQLENLVDQVFYNRQLKNNYFGGVYNKLENSFANLIYITRDAMINYFKKYDDREFYQIIQKYGNDFVIEHLKQNRELKAQQSVNLKLSLLQHKGKYIMDIQAMQNKIKQKLDTENYDTLNREEFFYLSGQIAKYLLNQSEAHDKKSDLIEPFLRSNNAQKLKKDIEFTYFKYKHKINLNHIRFNNAMSLVMSYNNTDKLSSNMDSFLVGLLSSNIFYHKQEK